MIARLCNFTLVVGQFISLDLSEILPLSLENLFPLDYQNRTTNALFKEFCEHFGIQNHYSSPAYPQANGQVEVGNRSLLKIIKTRLEGTKGVWPDEQPGVLWAYRMIVRTPTGETPFKLAYGSEAVIPAEVHMANHRVTMYQDKDNEEQLRLNLDLINEVRTNAEERTVWGPIVPCVQTALEEARPNI